MKEIQLTQGYTALVDDADYDWLNQYKWHVVKQNGSSYAYAARAMRRDDEYKSSCTLIFMHNQIMKHVPNKTVNPSRVYHLDRNGLNNSRGNLRIQTVGQQMQASRIQTSRNTSGYRGVRKRDNKWFAILGYQNRTIYLGRYATKEEAARAYDKKARKLFGDSAVVNFPEQS